jgi:undecaprenyl diphosphate synthase
MDEEMTKEEFMELSTEKIRGVVNEKGYPKVGVIIPDGTRRSGIIFYNMNPSSKDFEKKLFDKLNSQIIDKIKIIFDHGLDTLFMPGVTHGNFNRTDQYVDTVTKIGLKYIFNDESWLNFYNEYDIKVKIYGDLHFVKKMGYEYVVDWIRKVEEETKNNTTYKLYHGLACSNSYENFRILDLAIDFFKENNRNPTKEEIIKLYYGEYIGDVDFFIRPTVFRDSDIQPPLISGRKTQFYFPISPIVNFSLEMYREILYDMLFSRVITMSKKQWNAEDLNEKQLKFIRTYYAQNQSSILGIGERVGNLWLPAHQIKKETK